jgi:hypothetical protein
MKKLTRKETSDQGNVRFAVVGLGHIAQAAVLPAFQQASGCELAALVSGDSDKLKALSERYRVRRTVDYDGYDELLKSGAIDAVILQNAFASGASRSPTHGKATPTCESFWRSTNPHALGGVYGYSPW